MRRGGWRVGLAMVLLLGACSVVQPVPDAELRLDNVDTEPRQGSFEIVDAQVDGPIVEIIRASVGEATVTVTAARGRDGICTEIVTEYGGGGGGCGGLPGGMLGATFGTLASGGGSGGFQEVSGVVSSDVAVIAIEQRG